MQYIVDTHVHIYPFYNVAEALLSISHNLEKEAKNAVRVACLTERYDCDLFTTLAESPPLEVREKFEIEAFADRLVITGKNGDSAFFLLPGQQIITMENIEILSLNCIDRIKEGQSAPDTVRSVLSHGGIPVVAWAPGKWFMERGKVVSALLDQFKPNELALGDTTLRPVGWGTPRIIKIARQRGFKILFGSDPLPFVGEENRPGTYLTDIISISEANSGGATNPAEFMQGLLAANLSIKPAGSRGSIFTVLQRLYRNHQAPKPIRKAVRSVNIKK